MMESVMENKEKSYKVNNKKCKFCQFREHLIINCECQIKNENKVNKLEDQSGEKNNTSMKIEKQCKKRVIGVKEFNVVEDINWSEY